MTDDLPQLADALFEEHLVSDDLRSQSFDDLLRTAPTRYPAVTAPCRTCRGLAGPIVDATDLIRGKTFTAIHAISASHVELRQISSTIHEDDLDNVAPMDAINIVERMAKAEEFLLTKANADFPAGANDFRGWITITKNKRPDRHGSQRIRLHRALPPTARMDATFREQHGGSVPAWFELNSPAGLTLGEFRGGVTALLLEQPRKLFETLVYFRPITSGYLHTISGDHRWGLAQAIREITGALRLELAFRGLPESYCWTLHVGTDQDVYLHLWASTTQRVADKPADWCAAMQSHLGLSSG